LVGDPTELARRIDSKPLGRPSVDSFQVGFQVQLQAAVAAFYAIACGRPCFALDTTRLAGDEVAEIALELLRKSGVSWNAVATPRDD
jgi:hypothetical protein